VCVHACGRLRMSECVYVCVCVCARAQPCMHAPDVLPCSAFSQLFVTYWQAKQHCWRGITVWHRLKAESSLAISSFCWGAGQSVDKHLLSSYQYAIMAVILAQFTCKGFSDGMEGVVRLVEAAPRLQASSRICTVPIKISPQCRKRLILVPRR